MELANGVLLVRKNNGDYICMNPFKPLMHHYVRDYSVIQFLFITIKEYALLQEEEKYILTEREKNRINQFIYNTSDITNAKRPLIICVIESFNSVVINEEFMPHLHKFLDTTNNLLVCDKMITQVKQGGSSDGQMIIQTGLLPLNEGAACYRFCFNQYPSIPHLFNKSAIILPHEPHVWNQARMNTAYGIGTSIDKHPDNDKLLFESTIKQSLEYDYLMMLTISTHMPCTSYADSSNLEIPDSIPTLIKNYIKSVNVLDKGMKILFDAISTDEHLKESTIVITGDHCLWFWQSDETSVESK